MRSDKNTMSADYTIGQLIDEIGAQEELVEDLCVFAGNLLTEVYDLNDTLSVIKSGVYNL
jgi:hypothetical protein